MLSFLIARILIYQTTYLIRTYLPNTLDPGHMVYFLYFDCINCFIHTQCLLWVIVNIYDVLVTFLTVQLLFTTAVDNSK